MRTRRIVETGRASLAMAVGAILIATGSGIGLVTLTSASTAGAATSKAQAPIPVVEQNLDSAGRIRVAGPTNPGGQLQVSNGSAAATSFNGPWVTVGCCGGSNVMASLQGPGVFTGFTINTYGWACGCWNPDGNVTVNIDGQTVLSENLDWFGSWLNEGPVIGGSWRPGGWCGGGPCATAYWWPPGGISFQNNVTITYNNWTGNPNWCWVDAYHNSILPVTSSPN